MVVFNHTAIPDRTDYILDHSKPNPMVPMREDTIRLAELGANVIVTPCNTAHYFYEELSSAVSVPFLHMIDETALELSRLKVKRAGILATVGTVHADLFQQAFRRKGISPVLPNPQNQQYVMDIIYDNVKAGRPLDRLHSTVTR